LYEDLREEEEEVSDERGGQEKSYFGMKIDDKEILSTFQ
jgi:hypothetical protein